MVKKKKVSKSVSAKVKKATKSDLFTSVAIASVLLNILFLVSVLVLTSTNSFDRKFYQTSRAKYCENLQAVEDRAVELGDDKAAIEEWQTDCIGKDFKPFYDEAVEKYRAQD